MSLTASLHCFCGALLTLLLFTQSAHATSAILLTDTELITTSRVIVIGEITGVRGEVTLVRVAVTRSLKGNAPTELVFRQIGGIFDQPCFTQGQRVLLFLETARDGTLRIAQLFMGAYTVEGAKIKRTVPGNVRVLGGSATEQASLARFSRQIRRTLRGVPADNSTITWIPTEYGATDFSPQFTFLGFRWFDPAQLFALNPSGVPVNGLTAIQQGMNAWNGAGTPLNLITGGSTDAGGFFADGVSAISFDDPLDQVPDPVNCHGILAFAGASRIGPRTMTVGGLAFNEILEADVVFNRGFECFFAQPGNLAEVACHELGHAVGLGHSEFPQAIMFAQAHGGGRGAVLDSDDRAATRFLYAGITRPELDHITAVWDVDVAGNELLNVSIWFTGVITEPSVIHLLSSSPLVPLEPSIAAPVGYSSFGLSIHPLHTSMPRKVIITAGYNGRTVRTVFLLDH